MGAVAAIVSIATAATTITQSFIQSKAIKSQGEFESGALRQNAQLAELQSQDAIFRGEKDVAAHARKVKQLIGSQRASLAAQGLDLESGSALDVQLDTAGLGAEDELTIRNNAWRESWGYRVQSSDYLTQASMRSIASKAEARNTMISGGISAGSDLGFAAYALRGLKTSPSGKKTT